MTHHLDHIVVAHPDLEQAIQEFADLTGCVAQYGGPHPGGGTHNALASLGKSVYIELISPDPAQIGTTNNPQSANLGQRLASLDSGRLLAWAIRSSNLDQLVGEYCGFNARTPFDMSRQQPDGKLLNWRLMNLTGHNLKGFAPFYIDWLKCPHPASTNPVAGEFGVLEITHPNTNLGELVDNTVGVQYTQGPANFSLQFSSQRGPITLSSSDLNGFWS